MNFKLNSKWNKNETNQFALQIIQHYQKMQQQNEFVLSKQLLRAGTSIGENIEEATAAQSRKDFISKMSISFSEARERNYWLRLLMDSNLGGNIDLADLIKESEEIIKILTSIVKTTQKKYI